MEVETTNGIPDVQYKSLCVYTDTGATFTFRNVTVISDNETFLIFNYRSTKEPEYDKTATFIKANIVGWSVLPFSS